jgi:hypothetical protein
LNSNDAEWVVPSVSVTSILRGEVGQSSPDRRR